MDTNLLCFEKSILSQVLAGGPTPPGSSQLGAPKELVAIIDKAMARSPEERYARAEGFAEELRRFTAGQLISSYRYTSVELLLRWIHRHRALVWLGTSALLVLLLVGIVATVRIQRSSALAARRALDVLRSEGELAEKQNLAATNDIRRALAEDPTSSIVRLAQVSDQLSDKSIQVATAREAVRKGLPRWARSTHGTGAVRFAPSGSKVAVADRNSLEILDAANGSPEGRWPIKAVKNYSIVLLHWLPNDGILLVRSDGVIVRVAAGDVSPTVLGSGDRPISDAAIDPGMEHVALLFADGSTELLAIKEPSNMVSMVPPTRASAVRWVDGRGFVLLTEERQLIAFGGPREKHISLAAEGIPVEVIGHAGQDVIYVGTSTGELLGIDWSTGKTTFRRQQFTSKVSGLSMTHDGSRLVAYAIDGTAVIETLKTNALTSVPRSWFGQISADDRWLVTVGELGTLTFHNLETGWSRVIQAHKQETFNLDLDEAGNVVTGSEDETVRFWPSTLHPTTLVKAARQIAFIAAAHNDFLTSDDAGNVSLWTRAGRLVRQSNLHRGIAVVGGLPSSTPKVFYSVGIMDGNLFFLDDTLRITNHAHLEGPVVAAAAGDGGLLVSSNTHIWLATKDSIGAGIDTGLAPEDGIARIAFRDSHHYYLGTKSGRILVVEPDSSAIRVLVDGPKSRIALLQPMASGQLLVGWSNGRLAAYDPTLGTMTELAACGSLAYPGSMADETIYVACDTKMLAVDGRGSVSAFTVGAQVRDVDASASAVIGRANDDAIYIWTPRTKTARALPVAIAAHDAAISADGGAIAVVSSGMLQFWSLDIVDNVPLEATALQPWLMSRSAAYSLSGI